MCKYNSVAGGYRRASEREVVSSSSRRILQMATSVQAKFETCFENNRQ